MSAEILQRDLAVLFITQGKIRCRMIYFHKISRALTNALILNPSPAARKLFRRAAPPLLFLAVLHSTGLPAQTLSPPHRLRAIGLLTWGVNSSAQAAPRLFPIAVFDNGKFYDATLYHAGSRPLALEPDTVYEGQRSGAPVGFFTVGASQLVNGTWSAGGRWKVRPPENPLLGHRPVFVPEDDEKDARPHLKRSPEGVASKKATVTPAPAESSTADKTVDSGSSADSAASDDSDRPILRRGKPEQVKSEVPAPGKRPPDSGKGGKAAAPAPAFGDTMVAISDEQPGEPRAYAYVWKPEDEARMRGYMTSLAAMEMGKYLRGHNYRASTAAAMPEPGPTAPPRRLPPSNARKRRSTAARPETSPAFQQVQMRPFDLSTSNDQVIVYTAQGKAWAANRPLDIFITLLARLDVQGVPRHIFSQLSDTDHLDIFPRLELVDAVDAEGARHGDLLFRAFGAGGTHYVIYRVERDAVSKAFEGAYLTPQPANEP